MPIEILLYIIFAAITALFLALFQYRYKSKLKGTKLWVLVLLRSVSLCLVILLLINPKFESINYYNEKPNLVVAIDNSESISFLKEASTAKEILESVTSNTSLNNRFEINSYQFGNALRSTTKDELNFNASSTNLAKALDQLKSIYDNENTAVLLVTDGNQTLGEDYSYFKAGDDFSVYPIILGDTTDYLDLKIKQLNVNRYAYLKNKFPVEIIVNYSGNETVNSVLTISTGNKSVFRKSLEFDAQNTSTVIRTTILANSGGLKNYSVTIKPLAEEQNIVNNNRTFGVEVIDQKSKIALITDVIHPDLGALKKAISSNEQRQVDLVDVDNFNLDSADYQLYILYQPNERFKTVFKHINNGNFNSFVILGTQTNYNFFNKVQTNFNQTITRQTEEFQPILNEGFDNFIVREVNFEAYPPLTSEFGKFTAKVQNEVILFKTINGYNTQEPLLLTAEKDGQKLGILNGEGLWRWRAQHFIETQSFEGFDVFINKLTQWLSSNKQRKRLNVDYDSFYNANEAIIFNVQYFNKSYEFDDTAELILRLEDEGKDVTDYPILRAKNNYNIDLSGLQPGNYNFSVIHNSEPVRFSGQFQVLEFNVEQQFLNADVEKLKRLAKNTNANYATSDAYSDQINKILEDNRYQIVQKSTKNIVPLVDWKYLLGLIIMSLSAEWFFRKYNGLI